MFVCLLHTKTLDRTFILSFLIKLCHPRNNGTIFYMQIVLLIIDLSSCIEIGLGG